MGKVSFIAEKLDDNGAIAPDQALRNALQDIKEGDFKAESCLLIFKKDTGPEGWDFAWYASNAKTSELLSFVTFMQSVLLDHLKGTDES